jgi:hypothetical protein
MEQIVIILHTEYNVNILNYEVSVINILFGDILFRIWTSVFGIMCLNISSYSQVFFKWMWGILRTEIM